MKANKILPLLLLIIMAALAVWIQRCNSNTTNSTVSTKKNSPVSVPADWSGQLKFDRSSTNLFFSKHAKCRMKCRHITQLEVKEILSNGTINYNKSELNDPRGPSYAVEGITRDRQKVRIIFAPKQQHITVVTVIDLEQEFVCNCN